MAVLTVSRLTDETILVPIRARANGSDIDPTAYTATLAWVAVGTRPTSGDYIAAAWETDATVSPARYYATRKATTLAVGDFSIWVKIVTGTETLQREVGVLRVT